MFALRNARPHRSSVSCAAASPTTADDAAQHQRFGEELRDDPATTRAQRATHDELGLARRGSREQQQRHVSAYEREERRREQLNRAPSPRCPRFPRS